MSYTKWLFAALASLSMHVQAAAADIFEQRSLYRDIYVSQDGDLRCLRFAKSYAMGLHSCQRVDRPEKIEFEYVRQMMTALYLQPNPKRILTIGVGGGTLQSALQRIFPDVPMDHVELDPAVVNVAKRYFGFSASEKTRIYEEDGRVFVKRALKRGSKYDLIMLDAFDSHSEIPEHMVTREFLKELRSIMNPGAAIATNIVAQPRLQEAQFATYFDVFGSFYNLASTSSSNQIIIAAKGDLASPDVIESSATSLEKKFRDVGIEKNITRNFSEPKISWPPATRILTDQFSPANLLNTKQ